MFDYGEVVGDGSRGARGIRGTLLELFPEADQKCKNPNRLFFGSNGEVIPAWEAGARAEAGDE